VIPREKAGPERFRKTWRGTVISSKGFSVRLNGRTTLLYRYPRGQMTIQTEALAGPGINVAVYSDSIPAGADPNRTAVMDDVRRAFLYAGWHLVPS
jgi:hypothetical protein